MQDKKSEKKILHLFTDGSVNPKSKIGYGAFLFLKNDEIKITNTHYNIITHEFNDTSSTKLELQILLWALKSQCLDQSEIIIYTDCQNIMSLESRREKLEKNDFYTKKNTRIKNYILYKEFYKILDETNFSLIKLKGHKSTQSKNYLDIIFSKVDKKSRLALRQSI